MSENYNIPTKGVTNTASLKLPNNPFAADNQSIINRFDLNIEIGVGELRNAFSMLIKSIDLIEDDLNDRYYMIIHAMETVDGIVEQVKKLVIETKQSFEITIYNKQGHAEKSLSLSGEYVDIRHSTLFDCSYPGFQPLVKHLYFEISVHAATKIKNFVGRDT